MGQLLNSFVSLRVFHIKTTNVTLMFISEIYESETFKYTLLNIPIQNLPVESVIFYSYFVVQKYYF